MRVGTMGERLDHGVRIDRGHFDATVGKLLHDHVARQHGLPTEALRGRALDCKHPRIRYLRNATPIFSCRAFWTSISLMMPKASSFGADIVRATASSNDAGSVVLK